MSSIAAPIVEEGLKGLAVLTVFLLFRSEFDSILDGIVYAGITALGFAAIENALYAYVFGYREHGMEGMYAVLFVRGILGGWDHPMWTAFTGIGLAAARLTRNVKVKIFAPMGGWVVAVLGHSLHNTLLELFRTLGLLSALLADWSGWILIFVVMVWATRREKSWIVKNLRDEVGQGMITAAQYRIACSSWAQYGARLRALFKGRYRITRRFYRATADLAFKKEQLKFDGEDTKATIDHLRTELAHLSPLALTLQKEGNDGAAFSN